MTQPQNGEKMIIELCCCENVLLDEISKKEFKRNDIALTMSMALRSSESDTIDWAKVNKAIIARWSVSGLMYIKERAWKIVEKGVSNA